MKLRLIFFFMMISFGKLLAQNEVIPLWKTIPNSIETSEKESLEQGAIIKIFKVKKPTLEVYAPAKNNATDKAIIICPGGGYNFLAYDWEGTDMAKWFNSKGITAFVLKYRLPNSKSLITSNKAPLQDAQRAIRWVRFNAKKMGINPNKIGVIGFSAGGHLASTLGTQFNTPNDFKEEALDTISARPDFMALIYPVVTMKDDYTHKGSRKNLLGKNPSKELIAQYSNELHVTENTPPTFIVHASNDPAVPVENSLQIYKALNDKGVKVEMHIYPTGKHGFSLAINQEGYLHTWLDRMYDWLESI
ncbi:alpha/beta hydrolase [Polaribacter sp. Q13]|uniref:alpha/beta hydrolase n=1 Tax=Polaribacter sp. Q13 TaxID=2806551 RepID=UPI00193AFB42|nr:alpha/beta hydrolase [Polaribacter sp. Q13]QVY66763.1 alpha/beta hydrolase [Polaribacter sp. Q13]